MPIIEYIRSYSSKLDKERIKILKTFKFKKEEMYKVKLNYDKEKKLYSLIYNKILNIL